MKAGSASPSCIKSEGTLSVRRQCELLGLPRSKVYYKPVQPSPEQAEWREQVMAKLDYWHTTMPYIGTRKLAKQLQKDGYQVGRKLVRRLMGEVGIHTIYPKANLSKRNFKESIVPRVRSSPAGSTRLC